MTEGTRAHIADIILELSAQHNEISKLVDEAMQDYSDAAEIEDMDAEHKAFGEIEYYMDAYSAVRKAIRILKNARENSK